MIYKVMFQYSICYMHFSIMKSELIFGISVGILEVFRDKAIFFLNSARRQIPLFAKKKKDLVRLFRKFQLLSE